MYLYCTWIEAKFSSTFQVQFFLFLKILSFLSSTFEVYLHSSLNAELDTGIIRVYLKCTVQPESRDHVYL